MATLTQKRLKELLSYDANSGLFTWATSRRGTAKKGTGAGWIGGKYANISVDGVHYPAHRLAWLYMTGSLPLDQIDHINHNRLDNRFINLREASNNINGKNQSKKTNNKSGHNGVHWYKQGSKWHAQILVNGIKKHLGYFENINDAIIAREAANNLYGFHINHGENL